MRVLFTTYAEKTHFLAMAPLAWALRTAGHEVVFASQRKFAGAINQAGLTAVPVGSDRDPWRLLEANPGWLDGGHLTVTPPYDVAQQPEKATWDHLLAGYREAVTWWHKLINVPMIPDLVEFARHWRPDLVIWEPLTYAGAVAAKTVGAAHARLMWGLDVFGVTRDHFLRLKGERGEDPLAEWLGSYVDFSEDLATGHFTIDRLPGSLRIEADLHYVPMRFVPYGGAAVVPDWLRTPPTRPRVAITMGFSATDHFGGYLFGMQDILDAIGDLDIDIVATIPDGERRKLTRVPPGARLVPYVPLHALAPTCAAAIHHAGPGTLATFALDAVPQLALPMHYDEPPLARMLADQGAGLAVDPREATGEIVRDALLRLLKEPSFTEGAERLRAELLDLPSPGRLVPRLEELTAEHRAA
ncbi:activator-dependent family glycosyltransferase [Nonomuraea angiospora]|uniref:activator-dependent family glycosyltransferase n=1 Tax=Nonomuraea angiospora TaxID=46172 RepID=UPI003438FEE8